MTGWQLEPASIGKTLIDTETNIQAVRTALQNAAAGAGKQLATGAGFDGVVVQALAGFLEEQSASRLQPLMNRYGAGLEATANAANAFLAGDEQMADSTIATAGDAAATGDATRFQGGS